MCKVLVLLLLSNNDLMKNYYNIKSIKKSFSNSFFHIEEVFYENEPIKNALFYSKYGPYDKKNNPLKKWENLPCIIIKSDNIINISPDKMYKKIKIILEWGKFDICYLHRYMDNCLIHRKTIIQDLFYVSKNKSKQGILYTRFAINSIINNKNIKFKKVGFVPNLIQYDIKNRLSEKDLRKTTECIYINDIEEKNEINYIWIFMYIILITLILITFIWSERKFLEKN